MRRAHLRIALSAGLGFIALASGTQVSAGPGSGELTGPSSMSGPSPRAAFGMAYHAPTKKVVLFGGYFGGTHEDRRLGDTWTWDGTRWTQERPANSPSPRCCAAMAYDGRRGEVVLHGGDDGSARFDTWIWDGANWTERHPLKSPKLGCCAGMAFDPSMGVDVLHAWSQTWTWDGSDWTEQDPRQSPYPRENPGVAREGSNVILFGGDTGPEDYTEFRDTWRWDGAGWRKLSLAIRPPGRTTMGLAEDVARHQVVLFGGTSHLFQNLSDTWAWDGRSWTKLSPSNSPPGRAFMGLVQDQARQELVLFGGWSLGEEFRYFGDTWTWDGTNWTEH